MGHHESKSTEKINNMASYNKVILIGNLTRDVETRYTPKGTAVADISLAINRKYSTESGEKREEVTYVEITLWGKLAELAGQYLQKGSATMIEGRLELESWEDKQTGQKRSKLKVVGEVMQFLDNKRQDDGGTREDQQQRSGYQRQERPQGQRPASRGHESQQQRHNDAPITDGLDDDDIPF